MLPDFQVRQRDYLLDIIRALSQQLDLDTALARILEAASDILGGQAGLIAIRDDAGGSFRVRAQHRVTPEFIRHFDAILREAADRGDPARFVISEIERRLVAVGRQFDLSGTVGLPLQLGDELLGILLIFRAVAAPFGANERKLLQAFTDQAAIAVNNARLYQNSVNERRRLDAVLDGSADGILIMDSGHRIQRWNRALARLTGIGAANSVGRGHDEVIRWAKREPGLDLNDAEAGGWPFSSGSPLYVEGDLRKSNGSTVAVGITYAPIFDKENRLVNIVANVRDITRFREAEQLKSTFVSVVSHELKTPVSLIKGYAGTLRRDDAKWDSRTVQESLAVIEEEADRLAALIENLLDASRLQAGALKLNMGEVDLNALASELVVKFRTQTDRHAFVVEFPPTLPIVHGDEERLRQVLINLLSNAIKYSPDGGAIRVMGRAEPEQVVVTVSDEGMGLPDDELDKVFDRFYRADTPATRRAQGAGLGLYLAKAVVEAHGGQIWASSEAGRGAAFSFSLPRE
ncbi:MAG: PAS domain S-box protein [Chloroflexi bacterium]|nr:PAS domain S-box protein [Chloroflexota bacterium]